MSAGRKQTLRADNVLSRSTLGTLGWWRRPIEVDFASIGECDVPAADRIGSVLRSVTVDENLRTDRQGVFRDSLPEERIRCPGLDRPTNDRTVRTGHVDVKPRVRIDEFHLGERSL